MTLREHLEAIRDGSAQHPYRYEPPLEFLIEIENHAVAALAIIDNLTPVVHRNGGLVRWVPDPEPSA